jgi:hypothetical protein
MIVEEQGKKDQMINDTRQKLYLLPRKPRKESTRKSL